MFTEDINYFADIKMIGHLAYEEKTPRPAIIVAHAFEGRNELACQYANKFASLGYVGFAIDMFGGKTIGKDLGECMGMITPMLEDRELLKSRVLAAFNTLSIMPMVDSEKIAAIGFCFGGMCVLDLARSGADVKGVVSVHGVLKESPNRKEKIKAKVLALHGFKDPQIPKEQIDAFKQELEKDGVDWQFHDYSIAKHAFTDPNADKIGEKDMGREYSELATHRAFISSKNFFEEVFS